MISSLIKYTKNTRIKYKEINNKSYKMENTEEPCIICFEENKEKILFDCNHSICLFCYSKLLENNNAMCPICRKRIDNYMEPMNISIAIQNIPVPEIPVRNIPDCIPDNVRRVLCVFILVGIIVLITTIISKYK